MVRGKGRLERAGRWTGEADLVVVLNGGQTFFLFFSLPSAYSDLFGSIGDSIATFSSASRVLAVHSNSHPPSSIPLPSLQSLFSVPSIGSHEFIIGITPSFSVVYIVYSPNSQAQNISLTQYSNHFLPIKDGTKVKKILPVDPMAWGGSVAKEWTLRDVLLSVSEDGELAFWSLEVNGTAVMDGIDHEWRCTGKVHTGRKGFSIARCSSTKKSALGSYFQFYG